MAKRRPRILYLLMHYPLLCETYVEAEIEALREHYEIEVVCSQSPADGVAYAENPAPYHTAPRLEQALAIAREFRPEAVHTHWLLNIGAVKALAAALDVPYTARAHSFDTLPAPDMAPWFRQAPALMRSVGADPRCAGILAFPFSRGWLEGCGVPSSLIHDCPPAVMVGRFHDRSPNGEGVMNTGACKDKKDFAAFIALAKLMPGTAFDLYPVSHGTPYIVEANRRAGSPVRVQACVKHSLMPAVYKAHRWLVYTASFEHRSVGWPVAVAEAQASGCGVAIANIRPDLRDYAGESAVYFDRIEELPEILSAPVPEAAREAGFEKAWESDVYRHIGRLTALWPQG